MKVIDLINMINNKKILDIDNEEETHMGIINKKSLGDICYMLK